MYEDAEPLRVEPVDAGFVPPARLGSPIEPRRLFAAVSRARRSFLAAMVFGAIAGTAGAMAMPRTYEARGVLVVDGGGAADEVRHMQTLSESVKLPTVLDRTRERLHLQIENEFLARKIEVERGENANLLTIGVTAAKADEALALASTVIDLFIAEQLAQDEKRLRETVDVKLKETAVARAVLEEAQKKWDAFRATNGVVDPTAQLTAAIDRLAKLETESDLAAVASSAEGAREEALRASLGHEPKNVVLSAREAHPVDQKLGELRAERKMLEGRLSADHPRMLSLEAQIAALASASGSAHATVTVERNIGLNPGVSALESAISTALADRAAARKKVIALETTIATATAEVKRLASAGGSASPFVVELHLARTRLDSALAAEAIARDGMRNPSAGVRLIAPPTRPDKPHKSMRKPLAIASPVIALFLTLLFVLLREVVRLRLFAPSEIAFWSRAPVIASSSWPARGSVVDLRLSIREELAGRDALLIPFGDAERAAVTELEGDGCAAWAGPSEGPELRRAARKAERVIVVVSSGHGDVFSISGLATRVGRDDAEIVVVSVGPELANAADRLLPRRSV